MALAGLPESGWARCVHIAAEALEARLPASEQMLFELWGNSGAVDAALGAGPRRIPAIAAAMAHAPGWGPVCAVLQSGVEMAWLEFDADELEREVPVPGLFWKASGNQAARLAAFGMAELEGAVSAFGEADYLGVFPARGGAKVRVCLVMQPDALAGFARDHNLPGAPLEAMAQAADGFGPVRLSLDAGEEIGPRIGSDIAVRTAGDVERIRSRLPGGVVPDLTGLDRWTAAAEGLAGAPENAVGPDPVQGQPPLWVRRLNHVKLVTDGGRLSAKIYLYAGLGWHHSDKAARVIEQASSSSSIAASIASSA